MYKFRSKDRFEMPGGFIVYVFDKGQIPVGISSIDAVAGQIVEIDGKNYTVLQVDAHPVSEADRSTIAEDFGLMVRPAS